MTRLGRTVFFTALSLGVVTLAILAVVLGIMVLAGRSAGTDEPAAFTVEANDSGATASDIEKTVADLIEQQVNGVEHLRRCCSRCRGDGSYRLEVAFEPGIDLNAAQVLVQNRIALAMPALPAEIQRQGVTVRKQSPGLLMIVCLRLARRAVHQERSVQLRRIQLKDEMARVPGVADVAILGEQNFGMSIHLDQEKLVARNLGVLDVTRGRSRARNLDAPADEPARPGGNRRARRAPGGPIPLDQLEMIVIKTSSDGQQLRLGDAASRIELGAAEEGFASLDGLRHWSV